MGQYTNPAGTFVIAAAPGTSGVAQVETATIVGTITLDGTMALTITAAGMTGSPLAVNVPVLNGDTATVSAAKAAVVLNNTPVVANAFVASSSGASLILTAIGTLGGANDATLNIAFTNGTCTGLTPNATSANTTAGVLGVFRGVDAGSFLVDTTNKTVYKNTGTAYIPVWTLQ